MSLEKYLHALRTRWLVVILGVVVGLAGGLGVFLLVPARYTATTSLFVVTRLTDQTSAAYQGAQLSELRTKSYTELVTSSRVSAEVVQRLGLPISPAAMGKEIRATSAPDSVVISVAVTDRSADRAARIADTVGAVVGDLVSELERPYGSDETPAIGVRTVEAAAVPTARSPSLVLTLGIGALAGLVLGVAGALMWSTRDRSVRFPTDLTTAAGAPSLGVLDFDAGLAVRSLIVRDDPNGPCAEGFRRLRTNLQHVDPGATPRVVAVTSALPGEGRTTIAVNLAAALGSAGYRVALVEADLRRPALAELLGLDGDVGLSRVLAEHAADADVVGWAAFQAATRQAIQHCAAPFDVLAAGPCPADPGELVAGRALPAVLAALRESYEFVLVDCPPLLPVADTASVAAATDGVVLLSRYRSTTRAQVAAAVDDLRAVSVRVLGTVLTMAPPRPAANAERATARYRPRGVVPTADAVELKGA